MDRTSSSRDVNSRRHGDDDGNEWVSLTYGFDSFAFD